jgi:ferredoxin-NADP reductase
VRVTERKREGGFRDFRVVGKVPESRIITSLLLEPVDPAGWMPFSAGQFLVLRVPAKAERRAMPRSYSVSSSPSDRGRYRITVKREASPGPGIPDGAGSCWLTDETVVGDTISAAGPRGDFVLDAASTRPVVLLSGGVGLTPTVSMLHALASPDVARPVHFIHACDNGEVHALRDEVLALARWRSGVDVHFCYRFPSAADQRARLHQSEGVLTRELLAGLLPPADRDYYMCGPGPFMKAVYGILRSLGVPRERIAYEFFGPASLLEEDVAAADAQAAAPTTPPAAAPAKPIRDWITLAPKIASAQTVEFRKSGKTVAWDAGEDSLLSLAEANGLKPEFSCRSGVCNTCRTPLLSGEIAYTSEPLDPPEAGEVLLCCAQPKGNVVLDI